MPTDENSRAKIDSKKPKERASRGAARQAVILVHGMGEQIPMDTIKGFVKTVWQHGDSGDTKAKQVWSKPDECTGSLELRRITTRNSRKSSGFANGVRSDFFELYWADLTLGSTWDQFTGWVQHLLIRPVSSVPKTVRLAWVALWVAAFLVLCLGIIGLISKDFWIGSMPGWIPQTVAVAMAAWLIAKIRKVSAQTFGRVVRYTRADPANIAARAAVRDRGLKLLRAIHASGKYDRVILVGHSLGSILAYDLLSYFWAEMSESLAVVEHSAAFNSLCSVEAAAALLEKAAENSGPAEIASARLAYRKAQAGFWKALAAEKSDQAFVAQRWLISDFVTFGSPLTHSEFLIASSREDLLERQKARELPTAPPFREELEPETLRSARANGMPVDLDITSPQRLFSYSEKAGHAAPRVWKIHHAAPFALVRWTNVYDPSRAIYKGDLIGGPLAAAFGPGVEDIDLSKVDGLSNSFTHTRYWSTEQSDGRKEVVKKAVNLLNEDLDWWDYMQSFNRHLPAS